MTPELARVESVFAEAVAKTNTADRAEVLDRLCGDDIEFRERVEALLAAHEAANSFLPLPMEGGPNESPGPTNAFGEPAAKSGDVITGRYNLLERIGEGGMGEVWVAKQTEPVNRKVALKLIKPGMDSKAVLTRFEQERQALALMDHPSIARVFDGGLTADGRPFFAMELVNGLPLTKFCDEAKLTPRERLELFVPVCQAVQHAHQKGIVHRDLKPSNVLVTLYDGKPVPKIIDFGLAKAIAGRLTDASLSTQFGLVLGTLEYMAPEQAGFSALDVDTRADIYALGVILYELLTGLRPFDTLRMRQAAMDEVFRILREEEPPRPSTRLSTNESLPTLAAVRRTEPKRLTAMMRGELDWVVMKCLEKDRNRRYETASGLARDVQRYLTDEAVEARPPSAGYRLRKLLRRNKGPVLAGTAIAVLLVSGTAVSTWQAVRATRAEGQAKDDRDNADKERQRAEHHLYVANMHRIRFELENNNVTAARALLDLYRPGILGTGEKVQPGWEWYYWDRVCHGELITLKGHPDRATDVAFSPDGLLATAGGRDNPVVKIWDSVTMTELRTLRGHEDIVNKIAFSPDGNLFATCEATRDGTPTVKLWDTVTWTEAINWKPEPDDRFQSFAFSPHGKTLAVSDKSKRVRFWDLVGEKWVGELPEGTDSFLIEYSPDGKLIAIEREGVQLWDIETATLQRTLTGHSYMSPYGTAEAITGLAFSPDGQTLATSADGTVRIRKVVDGTELRTITVASTRVQGRAGPVYVSFSPQGKYLVTSSFNSPVKAWDLSTGRELRSFFGPIRAGRLAFSPDGARLASAGNNGEVTIWDAAGEPEKQLFLDEMFNAASPTFSPDGKLLAERFRSGGKIGQVRVSDAQTGRVVLRLDLGTNSFVMAFAFSSDTTRMAVASFRFDPDKPGAIPGSEEVTVWDLGSQQQVGSFGPINNHVDELTFSPGDQLLATVTSSYDVRTTSGEVKLWDLKTRKERDAFPGVSMAFSPNGTTMAVVSNDKSIALFDLRTGEVLHTWPTRVDRRKINFSPNGNQLCDGSAVWDLSDYRQLCELNGNTRPAQFSPDGTRLFSLQYVSGVSALLQVWDAASGDLLASIPVQTESDVSLHPDGWRCAVSGTTTGTWIVDARPLTPELRLQRDAHNLVAHLVRRPLLKLELLEQLQRMKTISEPQRREALALAAHVEPPRDLLIFAASEIVIWPDRSEDEYRRALQWLEEANRFNPNDGAVLNTLGLALHRLGRFEDAVSTLERASQIYNSGYDNLHRGDLMFLAMAQHQLGRIEEARKTLVQSRDEKNRELVPPHLVREAEALIEGEMNEPKK